MSNILMVYALVVLVTMILYKNSQVFKYYTKCVIYLLLSMVAGTMFIPLMFIKPFDWRNALMPAWFERQVSKLLGIRWQMRGHKNIVQEEGSVILMNHQSFLDLLILAEIWPVFDRCTVIAKREVFYLWPFGLGAWLWGTVYINRAARNDALAAINQVATTITAKKAKICIFPEGTRHAGDKLLPFKKGAFHMAVASQAPLQPLVISKYKFYDAKNLRFDEGPAVISILPAIPTVGMTTEDIPKLIEKAHEAMSKEYDILNAES